MAKKAKRHGGSGRPNSKNWERVALDKKQLGDTGLSGFSGLHVWKGPVINGEATVNEGTKDAGVRGNEGIKSAPAEGGQALASKEKGKVKVTKRRGKRKSRSKGSSEGHSNQVKKAKHCAKVIKQTASNAQSNTVQASQEMVDTSAWEDLNLHPLIHKALGINGFSKPMPIQSRAITAAVQKRKDVLGAAQTGSGKTLAFGLPIIQILLDDKNQTVKHPHSTSKPSSSDTLSSLSSDLEEIVDDGEFTQLGSEALFSNEAEGSELETMEEEMQEGSISSLEDGIGDAEIVALNKTLGITSMTELEASSSPNPLKGVILAPTRELALQVCRHLQACGKICGIQFVPLVGGMSIQKQERLLNRCPEVIVATPGRLWDLISNKQPHVSDMSSLKFMVIDEADKMVKQGNFKELTKIMHVVPEFKVLEDLEDTAQKTTRKRGRTKKNGGKDESAEAMYEVPDAERKMQTFVFSATLTLPRSMHKRLRKGGGGAADGECMDGLMNRIRFRKNSEVIDLTGKRGVADGVVEACLPCSEETRDAYVYSILERHPGRTVIFVNAISSVKRVTSLLRILGIDAQPIHAAKQQRQRLKALDRFRDDPNGVLVATDVAARGLDIKDIRCVIHYQVAASADVYIHRSGRTARLENEGLAVSLVVPKEALRFSALFTSLNRPIPVEFPLDPNHVFEAKTRFGIASKIDEVTRKLEKSQPRDSWIDEAAREIGLDESELADSRSITPAEKEDMLQTRASLAIELKDLLTDTAARKLDQKFFTGSTEALDAAMEAAKTVISPPNEQKIEKKRGKDRARNKRTKSMQSIEVQQEGASVHNRADTMSESGKPSKKEMLLARRKHHEEKADRLIGMMMHSKGNRRKVIDRSNHRQKLYVLPKPAGRSVGGTDALDAFRQSIK